jgi:hypothetical protein
MSMIHSLALIIALTAGSVACHDKTVDKPAGEVAAKTADQPAGGTPVAGTPATPAGTPAAATPAAPAAAMPAAPGTPAAPASKALVSDADAERFYAFIERLVAVAVANQDDCAKMAAGVNAFVDANRVVIKDASDSRQQNKDLPPVIKEKMAKKFKDELGPAVTKKCAKDPAVMAAFLKIKAR